MKLSGFKKQLKEKIKILRRQGYPNYINLSIASPEEMQQYLNQASNWSPEPEVEPEPEPAVEIPDPNPVLEKIALAKTLQELGQAVCELSGIGMWKDWCLECWMKNGECRIYVKDLSYTNPKDRGYVQILPNGSKIRFWKGRDDFPLLPPLPAVEDNLEKIATDARSRAIARLNAEFGERGWTQDDLLDELERKEYQ